MKRTLIIFSVLSVLFFSTSSFAIHQEDDGLFEVRETDGNVVVTPEKTEPAVTGATESERIRQLEERLKKLETTTVTREEATGHIFNFFKGFEFRFGGTGIGQGSLNNTKNTPEGNSMDATGSFDFILSRVLFDHGSVLLHLEAGIGGGLDARPLFDSLLFGQVNYDAMHTNDTRVEVAELYYEGNYADGGFIFDIGRLDSTILFDNNAVANDETTQFLNGGFRNNTTIDFPNYSYGVWVKGTPAPWFYISAGAFDAATTGYDLNQNLFWMGEVGITPKFAGVQGHYRFYGWQNFSDHINPKRGWPNDAGWGIGYSFDQQITDWFTLFTRGGYRKKSVYQAYMAYSAGFGLNGSLYNRDNDLFGVAYGIAYESSDFRPGAAENVIEAFYRISVARGHVGITPDFQFIIHPTGSGVRHNVFVMQLRAQLDF